MRSIKYTLCRASGEIQTIRVPEIWTPQEVAAKLPHALVFVAATDKQTYYDAPSRAYCGGVFLVVPDSHDTADYVCVGSDLPIDDKHATQLWRFAQDLLRAKVAS